MVIAHPVGMCVLNLKTSFRKKERKKKVSYERIPKEEQLGIAAP